MKKRILFVDDEPMLLELYQAMFQSMGSEWETTVARSGKEALAMMECAPCDVIISDMRMPDMSGAELLNEVLERHPRTARLILSGYAEQASVAQCMGATHQYLSKPCDLNVLKSTLT